MNLQALASAPRLLLAVDLTPIAGARFQPTGFADLGAAEYDLPDGTPMLLVESAQSIANRLEATCLEGTSHALDPQLNGLPYVVANLSGDGKPILTSSLTEAHRLGSPYFLNGTFRQTLAAEMAYAQTAPLDWGKIYATLFKYDPNCLLHGVFLALLEGGRVRTPRAITGFIEASNVRRAVSGGVKNSAVDPTGNLVQVAALKSGERGVYSNVPYARVEYVAAEITAWFNLDLSLIRSYGLGDDANSLLISLALLKVRRFLDRGLRLRTACDLQINSLRTQAPEGFALPDEPSLLKATQAGINKCTAKFANPPVTRLDVQVRAAQAGRT